MGWKGKHSAQEWEAVDKYPLFWKVFGVLCILGGIDAIGDIIWGIVEFIMQDRLAVVKERYTAVTIAIALVAIIFGIALAVMFFILGVRMLRGKRKKAAFIANIMIGVAAIILICELMIWGMSARLLPIFFAIVILVIVQTYSDPTLSQERRLQRKLRKLETRQESEEGTLGRDKTGKGYIKLNFFNLFWIFVIACIIGLVIEDVYHIAVVDPGIYQDRAGLLYGPFSPIYGCGAVLMTIALNRFHDKNPIIVFLIAAAIGGAFEFFVSWFMETAFGIMAWDYSGTFLNIGGRTNFMFMCMWGVLGLLWVKLITPILLWIINRIPWKWRYTVTTVATAFMIIDCFLTLAAVDCWYQREAGTMDYVNASAITQFCNEYCGDDFMAQRFQSMTMDPATASRAN